MRLSVPLWRVACFALTVAVCDALAAGDSGPGFFPPLVVWFPPAVPVSGEAIPHEPTLTRANARLEPPSGLADFVSEYFYPALSTRLNSRLPGDLADKLDAYRARRGRLLNELADQLVGLYGADDETKLAELQAFAAQQSPRLIALEREAEELRRAIITGGLLHLSVDWSRKRKWIIGRTRFNGEHLEKEAEFQVVRAAAYYQDGFSTEQRGLLVEIAAELQQRARASRPIPTPRRGDPAAMFFSPAMARVRLPRSAPPELVTLISRFNAERTALKQQLYNAVLLHDRTPAHERTEKFSALADEQWPRLVELEKLAEQIRLAMAAMPPARIAAPPHIPKSLLDRIEIYNRDRRKFIEEFEHAKYVASQMVPVPRVSPQMSEDERVQLARKLAADRAALRAKVAQLFQEETRDRFEAMLGRYKIIQADLALVAAGQFDPETGRPLTSETLLRGYTAAMERFDVFGREEVIYRGYRMAMLMPGLSPEQRRLLFGAALVGLAQPLPHGEYLPTSVQPVPQS
jgi:hypothetical protein